MTYPNGQYPASALDTCCGGWLLDPVAAWALDQLNDLYRRAFGTDIPINQTYRALGKPTDDPDLSPATQWSVWRKYLRDGSPLAAHPGTSNHGLAIAADLGAPISTTGTPQRAWMLKHGPDYGWLWGEVQSESWHFTFRGLPAAAQKEYDAMSKQLDAIEAKVDQIIAGQADAASQAKRVRIALMGKIRSVASSIRARDKSTADALDKILNEVEDD